MGMVNSIIYIYIPYTTGALEMSPLNLLNPQRKFYRPVKKLNVSTPKHKKCLEEDDIFLHMLSFRFHENILKHGGRPYQLIYICGDNPP